MRLEYAFPADEDLWLDLMDAPAFRPCATRFAGGGGFEGEVGPGDIIFIPSRWPHAVVNLEAGIAVAQHFLRRLDARESTQKRESKS